jgi:hypothetical protein
MVGQGGQHAGRPRGTQIGGRGDKPARIIREAACNEVIVPELGDPDRHIDALRHDIDLIVRQKQVNLQFGVVAHEGSNHRGNNLAAEGGGNRYPELARNTRCARS